MSETKAVPQYLRDSEWEIARSLANLWVWSSLMETKRLPTKCTLSVYPQQMSLAGPKELNGKRVVITLTIEDEAK